ncbi:MAG: class I SAM-dependent methyltransferase [Gammaproteobacteria bacterium]|nr:class I SAM-dependent methyltransferase [Gammaproteobacteria bacterium]
MTTRCPNCDSVDGTLEFHAPAFDADSSVPEFDLLRCSACNLVGTRGVSDALLDEAYEASYYGAGHRKFRGGLERILATLARQRAASMIRAWRQGGGQGTPEVCDIGCGRGVLLKAFRANGANVLGLERSPEPIDADIASDVHLGSLDDESLADRRFDIIVIWHVLEHVHAPDHLLDAIAEHAADGALLALAVPNYASLQRALFGPAWFHLDLPRHLTHFEAGALQQRLVDRGFEITRVRHFDPVQNPYGFLQSALNRLAPSHAGEFYEQLKGGDGLKSESRWPMPVWISLAVLLMLPALVEAIVASLVRRGATVQITARKGKPS